jgi:Ribosomally synthesized peptide in Bacteroidetes
MKKLEKINQQKFEAKALNLAQAKSIAGGTQIATGETGGSDSNASSITNFPLRSDTDLYNDPIILQAAQPGGPVDQFNPGDVTDADSGDVNPG